MSIEVRVLGSGEQDALDRVAEGVFDHAIDSEAAEEFLGDSRHHLAVAIDDGVVIGMLTALHYIHPDKPVPELWINELGVAPSHRNRGIGQRLVEAALDLADDLGCSGAWTVTSPDNDAARRLYALAGGRESGELMFSFDRVKS